MKKIVVSNLFGGDYKEMAIDAIEQQIAAAIGKISRIKPPVLYPPGQDTIISFPKDPSVESPGIPILIEVELIEEGAGVKSSSIKNLANLIQQKVLSIRGFESRTVWVSVRALDNGKPLKIGIAQ